MGRIGKLLGWPEYQDRIPRRIPGPRDIERCDFHIARFERAIEQCEKGPVRLAELRRNLEYWQTVKTLVGD